MATPTNHAVCSASSSERWLHCTAAPRFEEQFPESTSEYAEEGRLAHSLCELFGRKKLLEMPQKDYLAGLGEITTDPRYKEEMARTAVYRSRNRGLSAISRPTILRFSSLRIRWTATLCRSLILHRGRLSLSGLWRLYMIRAILKAHITPPLNGAVCLNTMERWIPHSGDARWYTVCTAGTQQVLAPREKPSGFHRTSKSWRQARP